MMFLNCEWPAMAPPCLCLSECAPLYGRRAAHSSLERRASIRMHKGRSNLLNLRIGRCAHLPAIAPAQRVHQFGVAAVGPVVLDGEQGPERGDRPADQGDLQYQADNAGKRFADGEKRKPRQNDGDEIAHEYPLFLRSALLPDVATLQEKWCFRLPFCRPPARFLRKIEDLPTDSKRICLVSRCHSPHIIVRLAGAPQRRLGCRPAATPDTVNNEGLF
mgnify:CR=1 FL=1